MSEAWTSDDRERCPICGEWPRREIPETDYLVGCYRCGMYATPDSNAWKAEQNWNCLARLIREKLSGEGQS